MHLMIKCILCASIIAGIYPAPIPGNLDSPSTSTTDQSVSDMDTLFDECSYICKNLVQYQKLIGLKQTGELDIKTLIWINKPKCGATERLKTRSSGNDWFDRFLDRFKTLYISLLCEIIVTETTPLPTPIPTPLPANLSTPLPTLLPASNPADSHTVDFTVGINVSINANVNRDKYAQAFLTQFGYLRNTTIQGNDSLFYNAILLYQQRAKIHITGKIDEETFMSMREPRCGNSDIDIPVSGDAIIRKKRYHLSPHKERLKGNRVTYRISKYSSRLPSEFVTKEIDKAFKVWTKYTGITFVQVNSDDATVDLRFEMENDHGCGKKFVDEDDGKLVLGHALVPEIGKIHFNEGKTEWKFNKDSKGADLMQTAVHQIGHILGLWHSGVTAAVMYEKYSYKEDFKLLPDDIVGVQIIYGIWKWK